jgi:hypothetical protein
MGLVGCACIDELAISRDGAKVTATITDIACIDFFLGGIPVSISPNQDQILVQYYRGKNYLRSAVELITEVHEYQIDPELSRLKILKFSFIDQDKVSIESVIKPVITSLIKHGTALAVEFAGAFDDMSNDDLSKIILSDYAAFTHLGVKYHFVKIPIKLISQGDCYSSETGKYDFYRTASGAIAMYTSVNPPVAKDQEAAQAILLNKIVRYSKDRLQ